MASSREREREGRGRGIQGEMGLDTQPPVGLSGAPLSGAPIIDGDGDLHSGSEEVFLDDFLEEYYGTVPIGAPTVLEKAERELRKQLRESEKKRAQEGVIKSGLQFGRHHLPRLHKEGLIQPVGKQYRAGEMRKLYGRVELGDHKYRTTYDWKTRRLTLHVHRNQGEMRTTLMPKLAEKLGIESRRLKQSQTYVHEANFGDGDYSLVSFVVEDLDDFEAFPEDDMDHAEYLSVTQDWPAEFCEDPETVNSMADRVVSHRAPSFALDADDVSDIEELAGGEEECTPMAYDAPDFTRTGFGEAAAFVIEDTRRNSTRSNDSRKPDVSSSYTPADVRVDVEKRIRDGVYSGMAAFIADRDEKDAIARREADRGFDALRVEMRMLSSRVRDAETFSVAEKQKEKALNEERIRDLKRDAEMAELRDAISAVKVEAEARLSKALSDRAACELMWEQRRKQASERESVLHQEIERLKGVVASTRAGSTRLGAPTSDSRASTASRRMSKNEDLDESFNRAGRVLSPIRKGKLTGHHLQPETPSFHADGDDLEDELISMLRTNLRQPKGRTSRASASVAPVSRAAVRTHSADTESAVDGRESAISGAVEQGKKRACAAAASVIADTKAGAWIPAHVRRFQAGSTVRLIELDEDLDRGEFALIVSAVFTPVTSVLSASEITLWYAEEDIFYPGDNAVMRGLFGSVQPSKELLDRKLPRFAGAGKLWLHERDATLRFVSHIAVNLKLSKRFADEAKKEAWTRLVHKFCPSNGEEPATTSVYIKEMYYCEYKRVGAGQMTESQKFSLWLRRTEEQLKRAESAVENAGREQVKLQASSYVAKLGEEVRDTTGTGSKQAMLTRLQDLAELRLAAGVPAERETVFSMEYLFIQDYFVSRSDALCKDAEDLYSYVDAVPENMPRLRSAVMYEVALSVLCGRGPDVELKMPRSTRLARLELYKIASHHGGGNGLSLLPTGSRSSINKALRNGHIADDLDAGRVDAHLDDPAYEIMASAEGMATSPEEARKLTASLPDIPVPIRWKIATYQGDSTLGKLYRLARNEAANGIKYKVPVTRKGVKVEGMILPTGTPRHEQSKIGVPVCMLVGGTGVEGCPFSGKDCPGSHICFACPEVRKRFVTAVKTFAGDALYERVAKAAHKKAGMKCAEESVERVLEMRAHDAHKYSAVELKDVNLGKLRVSAPLELTWCEKFEKPLLDTLKGKLFPTLQEMGAPSF